MEFKCLCVVPISSLESVDLQFVCLAAHSYINFCDMEVEWR